MDKNQGKSPRREYGASRFARTRALSARDDAKEKPSSEKGASEQAAITAEPSAAIDESEKIVSESGDLEVASFEELELEPSVLSAIQNMGWAKQTPVQAKCLPYTIPGQGRCWVRTNRDGKNRRIFNLDCQ